MVPSSLKNDIAKDYGLEKSLNAWFSSFSTMSSGETVQGVATDIAVYTFFNFAHNEDNELVDRPEPLLDKERVKILQRSDRVKEAKLASRSSRKEMQV
ncbi:hypothetical protein TNCT_307351 [Trichonephila clavata]|uniref:Uncharacterized protein n=1 Tax=Trichonephila clavata TaxID=2740835 RepID=A0A8X6KY76_TRICU|nr:hypothetical protein TNCT_307351 [Trichonephila clavata]